MAREPERRCIVSGETLPASALLRFVVGPDDTVVFDAAGKLPGRGLWLSPRLDMLKTAAAKNMFSKAARARVQVPDGFVEQVTERLRARCLERLGLARRAGLLTQGFEKVRARLKAGEAGVLIEAADAARHGREKIERLAESVPGDVAVVALLTADEIGAAIGRDTAVHVVIAPGKMAQAFLDDAAKLAGVVDRPLDGRGQELSDARDGVT